MTAHVLAGTQDIAFRTEWFSRLSGWWSGSAASARATAAASSANRRVTARAGRTASSSESTPHRPQPLRPAMTLSRPARSVSRFALMSMT